MVIAILRLLGQYSFFVLTREKGYAIIHTNGRYREVTPVARNKYPEETVKLIVDEALKLFIQKGYDNTSIQDIINNLGGLSKGAIYHHFKSKEEIFDAVSLRIGQENAVYYDNILGDKTQNGLEKLRGMIRSAYLNPNNDVVFALRGKIMSDPRFLTNQITATYEFVAPKYVQPIIEQGIQDGSIQTDYPKELAEVIMTLLNIWANPVVARTTAEEMRNKLAFFSLLLKGIGIDILDLEDTQRYIALCDRYQ